MNLFGKSCFFVSRVINRVSCASLVAMMGVVVINVISRAFGKPIFGAYEAVGFLLCILVAFSIANCAVNKGHIAVNILDSLLPKRLLHILDAIVASLGAAFFFVLAWQCSVYAKIILNKGELSISMELPFYPLVFGIAFGFLMLAFVLTVDFFHALSRILNK